MRRDQSSPFNFTQYAVLSHNIEIVMWPPITMSSPCVIESCSSDEIVDKLRDSTEKENITFR